MAEKVKIKSDITKNIDKFAKQEAIIIKVLDMINGSDKEVLFKTPDTKLEKDLTVIKG